MSRMLGLAFTLAGIGLLGGTATAEARSLHEEMRARVIAEVGHRPTASVVRDALNRDPGFSRLLQILTARSHDAAGGSRLAEDAVQETMLKVWRGRPDIFLRGWDEVVRYLRTSTRRNLITALRRGNTVAGESQVDFPVAELDGTDDPDPGDDALVADFLRRLAAELDDEDRAVLASHLAGIHSERDIAKATGRTRYACGRSNERIERAVASLLAE